MSRSPFDTTRRFERKEGTIEPSITRNTGSNTVMGPPGEPGERGPVGAAGGLLGDGSITALRDVVGRAGDTRSLHGHSTVDDGGGGLWVWSDDPATDNGGTVLNFDGLGSNQAGWRRVYSGAIDVRWFGALFDDATDCASALNYAISALPSTGGTILLPPGVGRHAGAINTQGKNIVIQGSGIADTTLKQTTIATTIHGIRVTGATQTLTVRDLTLTLGITGAPADNGQKAIQFDTDDTSGASPSGCRLLADHVGVVDYNFGIYANGGTAAESLMDSVIIRNCRISTKGLNSSSVSEPVAAHNCKLVDVHDNVLDNNSLGDHSLYCYQAQQARVRDNIFQNSFGESVKLLTNGSVAGLPAIQSWVVEDNTFNNCRAAAFFTSDTYEIGMVSFESNAIINGGGGGSTSYEVGFFSIADARSGYRLIRCGRNKFRDCAKGLILFSAGVGVKMHRVEALGNEATAWGTSSPGSWYALADDGGGEYGTLLAGGNFDGAGVGRATLNVSNFKHIQTDDISERQTAQLTTLQQTPLGQALTIDMTDAAHNAPDWLGTHGYSLGDTVVSTGHNGYVFQCTKAGSSGGGEPSWPTVRAFAVNSWVTATKTTIGTLVRPITTNNHIYRAITVGTTGGVEPVWPTGSGATVVDGTVTWAEAGADAITSYVTDGSVIWTCVRFDETLSEIEAKHRHIKLVGALGRNRVIRFPVGPASGWWLIENATTGGFNMVVECTSGSYSSVLAPGGVELFANVNNELVRVGCVSDPTSSRQALYGGTPVAQPTISGALSSVTDSAAKAVLTSIIAALKGSTGINAVIDGTM